MAQTSSNTTTKDIALVNEGGTVGEASTAYIYPEVASGGPEMPRLKSAVFALPAGMKAMWKMEARYSKRPDDVVKVPASGGYIGILAGQTWNVADWYPSTFFGGDNILLTYQILKADGSAVTPVTTMKFQILGKNPKDATAKSYIQSKQGEYWFAWAIAQHESRDSSNRVYNQFANGRTDGGVPAHGKKGEPFYTPAEGNGWGMFQRDATGDSANPVTVDEVWNWKANVDAGIAEFGRKKSLATNYFVAVKRTYPDQWEEPPATFYPFNKSNAYAGTCLTYIDGAIMTLYNGASVNATLWTGSYDNKGNKIWASGYLSCWKFSPGNSAGNRWKFVPNSNDYVYKVLTEEFEATHKPIVE